MNNLTNLRQTYRRLRRALSPSEQRQHSLKLVRRIKRLRWLWRAKRVAAYLAVDGELSLAPLIADLQQTGKRVYLPVLRPQPQRKLWFARYTPHSRLQPNRFAILEPSLSATERRPAWILDVILLPLVAFDADCRRIGMGGGFYDRTLAYQHRRLGWQRPRLIGIAHECQRIERVFVRPWDIPLDAVVTERKIYGPC
jgi:5-formyltetrahydrofolate cyclo-ligase